MKMRMTVVALLLAVTPQMRATINRVFRPDDFEIVWTANASEAVAASERHRPSLVLLELDQPLRERSGILEKLTKLNPGAPVVVLTEQGAADEESVAGSEVVVLRKPFDTIELEETAKALLKAPSSNRASEGKDLRETTIDSDEFRKKLLERYNTPFVFAPSYRHWGINE